MGSTHKARPANVPDPKSEGKKVAHMHVVDAQMSQHTSFKCSLSVSQSSDSTQGSSDKQLQSVFDLFSFLETVRICIFNAVIFNRFEASMSFTPINLDF